MKTLWKLQDAKAQFSKVVKDALKIGPQFVTRRGATAVVILSAKDYEDLVSNRPDFKSYLLNCPKVDDDMDFGRLRDVPRRIDL